MKVIGIDIGTTSISSVVFDPETGRQLLSRTIPNDTAVPGPVWARQLDAEQILETCRSLVEEYKKTWPDIGRLGLTGQMHGILYLDGSGKALSPLTTWEDERGNLPFSADRTYAEELSARTGYPMATGYGLTTHFYNLCNHLVPEDAKCLCTIMDYVAVSLTGAARPRIHASNAASLGLYRIKEAAFDGEAVTLAGMDPSILPEVSAAETTVGTTPGGIEVMIPVGDNQAGMISLVHDPGDVIVNVGTSSQISVVSSSPVCPEGLECRPYIGGQYLHIGAGLCGGTSFRLLHDFFCETCRLFSAETGRDDMFVRMMEEAEKAEEAERAGEITEPLLVSTLFRGKRDDPSLRGSITGITPQNFTPGSLVLGFYRGVCTELYESYLKMKADPSKGKLVLCGNAFRSNALLRNICKEIFQRDVYMSGQKEEAASGAAILAGSV